MIWGRLLAKLQTTLLSVGILAFINVLLNIKPLTSVKQITETVFFILLTLHLHLEHTWVSCKPSLCCNFTSVWDEFYISLVSVRTSRFIYGCWWDVPSFVSLKKEFTPAFDMTKQLEVSPGLLSITPTADGPEPSGNIPTYPGVQQQLLRW